MTDPFEVRMRFTHQIQQLNASISSAHKAAQYALKYKDMDEDLHSCIIEQVEKANLNVKANIMYFIEHFLDAAQKEGHSDYMRMMQRDIIRVVDAVAPDEPGGAANILVVRRVIQNLNSKGYLEAQVVSQIGEVLKERATNPENLNPTPSLEDVEMAEPAPLEEKETDPTGAIPRGQHRLEKRLIEQRIEEDRERHKRERENTWAVPANTEESKIWEEISDFGEDDDRLLQEEAEEYRKEMENQKCPPLALANGDR